VFTPVFYVTIRKLARQRSRRALNPPTEPAAEPQ